MNYQQKRNHIINRIKAMLDKFDDIEDFSDRHTMGAVHKVASDTLYQLRTSNWLFDYMVKVNFKDFMDEQAGYAVDVKIWPTQGSNIDNFVLFVTPKKKPEDDAAEAYARAMSIL